MPPADSFPLRDVSFTLSDGTAVSLTQEEVFNAQRYAPFASGPLSAQLRTLMQRIHAPPIGMAKGRSGDQSRGGELLDVEYDGWELSIAAGSMSSVEIAVQIFLDAGDILLVSIPAKRHFARASP